MAQHVDFSPSTPKFQGFFLTISPKEQFTPAQAQVVKQFHQHFERCLLVSEVRADGCDHYHSVYSSAHKKTNSETRVLERLFTKNHISFTVGVTIKLKKVSNVLGLFHYLLKDVTADNPPLLLSGWQMSWIKQQCLDNVKNIPRKLLDKEVCMVTKRNGAELLLAYAKAAGMPIQGKECFIEVFLDMEAKHYNFSNVRLVSLYTRVMSLLGIRGPSRANVESELFNLP